MIAVVEILVIMIAAVLGVIAAAWLCVYLGL